MDGSGLISEVWKETDPVTVVVSTFCLIYPKVKQGLQEFRKKISLSVCLREIRTSESDKGHLPYKGGGLTSM